MEKVIFRYVVLVVILVVGALFAIYVWPTRYKYDHLSGGGGSKVPVRIDRITGEAEMLVYEGWRRLSP